MMSSFKKLRVIELKAELEARGLPTDGLKSDLIKRLIASMENEPDIDSDTEETVNDVTVDHEDGERSANSNMAGIVSGLGNLLTPLINRPSNYEIASQIPHFKGSESEDIDKWIDNIEMVRLMYDVPDDTIKVLATSRLQDKALSYYYSIEGYV